MCMSVQSGLNGDSGNSSDVADLPHTHTLTTQRCAEAFFVRYAPESLALELCDLWNDSQSLPFCTNVLH